MKVKEDFGWPVIRYGGICEQIDPLTFDQADSIAKLLKSEYVYFSNQLREKPDEFGYESARFSEGVCDIQYWEGPVVYYPELTFKLNGITIKANVAITVCRAPRHSKIWIRILYEDISPTDKNKHKLSRKEIKKFFDSICPICEHTANVLLRVYQKAIETKTNQSTKSLHTIRILTCTADLGLAAISLENETFNIKDIFGHQKQFGSIPELLYMTYGKPITTIDQYKQYSDKYEWISMTSHEKNSLIGLYSIYHHESDPLTDFKGLVHAKDEDTTIVSKWPREFSRRLFRDIAPMI